MVLCIELNHASLFSASRAPLGKPLEAASQEELLDEV
jgi:hypothetical protein